MGKGAETENNVARAKNVAQTMLDEGVITPLASHETMAERASRSQIKREKLLGTDFSNWGNNDQFFDPKASYRFFEL